jgi:hypothetical protein
LEKLIKTQWHQAEFAELERVVCNNDNNEVSVMAPFWAEFFDVETNLVGEDSVQDPDIGCDMKCSGKDNTLMLYHTLCTATESATRACADHPEYDKYVHNTLPSVCVEKHGQPVVRSRLGALRGHFQPLCEQRPNFPATCDLKHGTLHGHHGISVTNLEIQQPVEIVQAGFWKKENYIFRGVMTDKNGDDVKALQLLLSDIGGHCLDFKLLKWAGCIFIKHSPTIVYTQEVTSAHGYKT